MTNTLRVYVACLASYTNGTLFGAWIEVSDTCSDADDVQEQIDAMLSRSPEPGAEEWAIHDWESPVAFEIGEYESPETLIAYAELLDDVDIDVLKAAAAELWTSSEGPQALRVRVERCCGAFDAKGEYAEETFGDAYDIPAPLAPYIDWKALERDMELSGDITTVYSDGQIYVFDNHD